VKTSTPLPVVVFSHGVSGMRTFNSAVCCDLASHGYLVAAIEHRSVLGLQTFFSKVDSIASVDYSVIFPKLNFVLEEKDWVTIL